MYDVYKTKYTTIQGETWDTISEDFYDTPYKVADLISVNPQYSDVLVFDDGVELNIPILDTQSPDTLPPWKRGTV
jgi:hypothetical protein